MKMSKKLKPCPFCGGEAHVERMGTSRVSMQIDCGDCGAGMETGETWIDEHSSWNGRPSHDRMMGEIAELKGALMEIKNTPDVRCDECPSIASAALAKLNQEGEELNG